MEKRSPQELTALRDVAYVLCYGHFPCQDDDSSTRSKVFKINGSKPTSSLASESSSKDDGNPFSEEDETEDDRNPFGDEESDHSPTVDSSNPFGENEDDKPGHSNPFDEDDAETPSNEDFKPLGEDDKQPAETSNLRGDEDQKHQKFENKPREDDTISPFSSSNQDLQNVINITINKESQQMVKLSGEPTSQQAAKSSQEHLPQPTSHISSINIQSAPLHPSGCTSTLAARMLTNAKSVSRTHAKEIVAEAFNVTQLDLGRIMEDTYRTKDSPAVELLLEDIRTEGLPVSPAQGNYPIIFLRARLGKHQCCTSFSSTSASNTIHQSFTLAIENMYKDTLVMEVWCADILPEEVPQSPHKKDFLGRIMSGSMRLTKNNLGNRISKLGKSPKESVKEDAIVDNDAGEEASQDSQESQNHLAEKEQISEVKKDSADVSIMLNGVEAHDDLNQSIDKADSVSISSEHSIDPYMTSTPRGRSSSMNQLEVTNAGDASSSEKSLQKDKGFRSSFRLKPGFVKAFKRSNQNIHDDSLSPNNSGKAPDTISIQSGYSDISSNEHFYDDKPDASGKIGKVKLNREASKSTLSLASITSLTRRKLSMKKATQAMKRIGSIRGKNKDVSNVAPPRESEHQQIQLTEDESPGKNDSLHGTSEDKTSTSNSDLHMTNISSLQSSFKKSLTPRPLRQFKNMMGLNGLKDEIGNVLEESLRDTDVVKPKEPDNPPDIQAYLSSIEKGHLQAELLASTNIPLKGIVGVWIKKEWFPMALKNAVFSEPAPVVEKSKKSSQRGKSHQKQVCKKNAKVLCRMHVRLAMPQPESELHISAYDTYSFTYGKLINLQTQFIPDLTAYKGNVGVVGDIILQQLYFLSRVSMGHKKLAEWLVLSKKKSSDSVLLYPLLQGVKAGMKEGEYNTTEKSLLAKSLSKWVRYVIPVEFEMLHTSFPAYSQILDPPRLENFLRCFKEIEYNTDLQILFEREMNTISFPCLTDQLKGALAKHAEIWIKALNEEPALQVSNENIEVTGASPDNTKWHENLKRAALLTKPIVDFLCISVQTYQPIFMTELSVDYLYWVMPKFLTAALHLISNTKYFTSAKIHIMPAGFVISAAQAAWKICNNLSAINGIGVKGKLPVHLIEQEYRTAFSMTVLQWLALSERLSLDEMDSDILQDEFVAVDPNKGYSRSALNMIDLLKAIMNRLQGLCWPGGVQPGKNTLIRIARHIFSLITEYKKKVIHSYNIRGGHIDRIPTQACVVVRNIEHVCDEARQQLSQLASWAEKESHIQEELQPDEEAEGNELQPEGRSQKLQSLIDDAAEKLLQKCLPRLEELLNQAVSRESSQYIIGSLQTALQPIEDRLYFAEPLLYALWYRLFQHATCLKDKFSQGQWRKDLQRLQNILKAIFTFLVDSHQIGLNLPDDSVQDYEKLFNELSLLGASSSGLVAQYYHERYNNDQCKEESAKNQNVIVTYVAYSREGLKVHILQSPGNQHQRGVLLKVRAEPVEWFPHAAPQKTRLVKSDVAVFDEVLNFPEVQNHGPSEEIAENNGVGGFLVFQVRTPRLFGGSYVHHEAIIPLEYVPKSEKDKLFPTQYRLPLTRPWSFTNYRPLEALKSRLQDKPAMDFLKALHSRWEGTEDTSSEHDSQRVNSSFMRASSIRFSSRSSKRSTAKTLPVK